MDKIGLFGGSFNPIHHGHLIIARALAEHVGLSSVIFLPCGEPPHKDETELIDVPTMLNPRTHPLKERPPTKYSSVSLFFFEK